MELQENPLPSFWVRKETEGVVLKDELGAEQPHDKKGREMVKETPQVHFCGDDNMRPLL